MLYTIAEVFGSQIRTISFTENSTSGVSRSSVIRQDVTCIMDSCRSCMARSEDMSCIFDVGKRNIINEIQFCTGIQYKKDDGLPRTMCNTCLNDLSVAYKFKTACLLADETFKKLIISNIKTEKLNTEFEVTVEYGENDRYDETTIKSEFSEMKEDEVPIVQNAVVGSGSIMLKNEENGCTKAESKPSSPSKVRVKGTKPPRLKKCKFKKLWCEPCSLKFDTKKQLTDHKREKHKDADNWVCEICGKLFLHRASHYTHIKSHLPPNYGCDRCDYKTWHKYDLVKHIRIHTGTKQYQCEYCSSSYHTSSNLLGHIRRNHMKLRPHICPVCHKRFFDTTKLKQHIDSHNEIKRFECEVCRACFSRRCYWKKHLLRQHNITTPPQRPGRQKTNLLIGEDLIQLRT